MGTHTHTHRITGSHTYKHSINTHTQISQKPAGRLLKFLSSCLSPIIPCAIYSWLLLFNWPRMNWNPLPQPHNLHLIQLNSFLSVVIGRTELFSVLYILLLVFPQRFPWFTTLWTDVQICWQGKNEKDSYIFYLKCLWKACKALFSNMVILGWHIQCC